jgi:uncharacterized protein (DUF1330 family)
MPKGYWIARVDVADLERYKAYVVTNALPFKTYGARFLVRGGRFENPEGTRRARNVVLEFPSYQAALDCWNSAECQAVLKLRQPVSTADRVVARQFTTHLLRLGRRERQGLVDRLQRQRHPAFRPGERTLRKFSEHGAQCLGAADAGPCRRSLGRRIGCRPAGGDQALRQGHEAWSRASLGCGVRGAHWCASTQCRLSFKRINCHQLAGDTLRDW